MPLFFSLLKLVSQNDFIYYHNSATYDTSPHQRMIQNRTLFFDPSCMKSTACKCSQSDVDITLWLCHLQVLTAMWRLHARPLGLDTTNKTFSILHCCNLNYGTYFWRRISLALKTKRDTLWLITKVRYFNPDVPIEIHDKVTDNLQWIKC